MGMYTALHFNSAIKCNTPPEVIKEIESRVDEIKSDSYYFDEDTITSLRFDKIHDGYYLNIRLNTKNYAGEIEKFVEWVTPYLDKRDGEFLGFMRYEETEIPTLLYYPNKEFTPQVPQEITEDSF